jgi:hypothetical protein
VEDPGLRQVEGRGGDKALTKGGCQGRGISYLRLCRGVPRVAGESHVPRVEPGWRQPVLPAHRARVTGTPVAWEGGWHKRATSLADSRDLAGGATGEVAVL